MKVISAILLILSVEYSVTGGGKFCGQYTSSILSIVKNFDSAAKMQKENSFLEIEKAFNNKTIPLEERGIKIYEISDQSKQNFDKLETKAYEDLGKLIGRDPNIIARKLLHASDVSEFPFVCVMEEADYISLQTNIISKSVTTYANKCISELEV